MSSKDTHLELLRMVGVEAQGGNKKVLKSARRGFVDGMLALAEHSHAETLVLYQHRKRHGCHNAAREAMVVEGEAGQQIET